MAESELVFFFGTECVHCHHMTPLLDELDKEEGIKVERLEVYHNEANLKKLQSVVGDGPVGLPYFYNYKTKKSISGSTTKEKIKEWATGA